MPGRYEEGATVKVQHKEAPDWVTVSEAARRLSMSSSWFGMWAKDSGVEVVRRGPKPGVNWLSVEQVIETSLIGTGRQGRSPHGSAIRRSPAR